jgi:hypothetical protein
MLMTSVAQFPSGNYLSQLVNDDALLAAGMVFVHEANGINANLLLAIFTHKMKIPQPLSEDFQTKLPKQILY